MGLDPVVPLLKSCRHPWQYDKELYKKRNEAERLFWGLKGYRRVFSRLDKLEGIFTGLIAFPPHLCHAPLAPTRSSLNSFFASFIATKSWQSVVWAIDLWIEVSLVFLKQLRFRLSGSEVFLVSERAMNWNCRNACARLLQFFRIVSSFSFFLTMRPFPNLADVQVQFPLRSMCFVSMRQFFSRLASSGNSRRIDGKLLARLRFLD